MRKIVLLFGIILFISGPSLAQPLTQTVTGTVRDKDTHRPLQGATVSIADDSIHFSTTTNEAGVFILTGIALGRRRIECTFIGYDHFITDNIILNSAKSLDLVIELEPRFKEQSAVIVKASRNPK